MVIRETPWEQVNLGVPSSAVFYIDPSDSPEALETQVIQNREYAYQEAVVPIEGIRALNTLLAGGFRMAEVAIHTSVNLPAELPKPFQRHAADFSCAPAEAPELHRVYEAIRSGNVFQTDKISLNPRFGPEVAARRYLNWARQEIERGNAVVHMVRLKDRNIGFSILKMLDERTCDGLLVGFLDPNAFSGLGVYLGYCTQKAAGAMGARVLKAHVSSNNMPVIKVNQLIGYQIERMNYVLIREIAR